jgi:hypothetical protein
MAKRSEAMTDGDCAPAADPERNPRTGPPAAGSDDTRPRNDTVRNRKRVALHLLPSGLYRRLRLLTESAPSGPDGGHGLEPDDREICTGPYRRSGIGAPRTPHHAPKMYVGGDNRRKPDGFSLDCQDSDKPLPSGAYACARPARDRRAPGARTRTDAYPVI